MMTRAELLATAKPIVFTTDEVRAILQEQTPKTQIRRPIKPQPPSRAIFNTIYSCGTAEFKIIVQSDPLIDYAKFFKPQSCYKVGDILYVRETWAEVPSTSYAQSDNVFSLPTSDKNFVYIYKAGWERCATAWKPSTDMPKEAARIFLRVTAVRAERLQNISPNDICAEGIVSTETHGGITANRDTMFDIMNRHGQFVILWNNRYAKRNGGAYSWESNPWVEVDEFEWVEAK